MSASPGAARFPVITASSGTVPTQVPTRSNASAPPASISATCAVSPPGMEMRARRAPSTSPFASSSNWSESVDLTAR